MDENMPPSHIDGLNAPLHVLKDAAATAWLIVGNTSLASRTDLNC